MLMTSFAPYVGTAPGTTTMGIPSISPLNGLGVCPPGHYGAEIMLPGMAIPSTIPDTTKIARQAWNPYATESQLKSASLGASAMRWDLLVLSYGLAFAGVLGFLFWRARKTK